MTRRRLAALLAALLLLPGEAARAAVWCGAANAGAANAAALDPALDAQPAPMDHARHHAMMLAQAADFLPTTPQQCLWWLVKR